ncbi:hypothetical protein NDU88_003887 [Pleurodeles waltl]|uniref:Uncharacterized protein n=1 Tax=Pleurodeles waltl TaxID=8319 RepID=A0AAV7WSY0_PLEWA|nr:hypothetical protein NDU88_003887 [Pleurodeles waltl]
MAAPSADHHFASARVNSRSEAPSSWDAPGSSKESEVVIISDEEEEVQQGRGGGPSGCDKSHAYSGHGAQVRHRRSGWIVGGQSLPVKVQAPSEHCEERRVRSGAVHPTSGENIGAADVQPSTSQGAGAGWTYGDEELLDYEDEFEDPVTFHKRMVVAGEAPVVARGGHVLAPPRNCLLATCLEERWAIKSGVIWGI